jgi:DNA-binding response OmpR family regulator
MGRKRILVIDDNEDLADGLREMMELRDHEVDVAYAGLAGAGAASRNRYDFILIDIGLPDIDGLECARRIRDSGSDARILFMTGYSAADIPTHIELEGAELLTKPLNPEMILERIG